MKLIGLMPSNTGAVGGKETGQRMSHYILPDGAFAQAFAELAATGWKLNLQSTIYAGGEKKPKKDKTKYTCPSCGLNMWANIPDADISCNSCQCVMPAERPPAGSLHRTNKPLNEGRMGNRPSFGRSKSERGLDQFDTPPIALAPLFAHEPLLAGVKAVCEPFCGKGNLVVAMRERGLTVHASDIEDRGCPDSTVLDFLAMTQRPWGCDVLLSNPPYAEAMRIIEHALALGFRVIVLLLKLQFTAQAERYERLHKLGHLRRVHVLAERCRTCMTPISRAARRPDKARITPGSCSIGTIAGPSTINPVSINRPAERMPWPTGAVCEQCRKPYQPRRSDSRFCGDTCRQRAHRGGLTVTSRDTVQPYEPNLAKRRMNHGQD